MLVGDNRPAGEQQAGCEVSRADRHPHEQPRELLVVEGVNPDGPTRPRYQA